jgi:exopolysaccharide biosynthesis polyprenyl glycosylphosphotransferase
VTVFKLSVPSTTEDLPRTAPGPRPGEDARRPDDVRASRDRDHRAGAPSEFGSRRNGTSPPVDNDRTIADLYRGADVVTALIALTAAFLLTNLNHKPEGLAEFLSVRLSVRNLLLIGGFLVSWRIIFSVCGLYDLNRVSEMRQEACRVLLACLMGSAVALVFPLISVSKAFSVASVVVFFVSTTAATLVLRGGVRLVVAQTRPAGYDIVIVGSGPRAGKLFDTLVRGRGRRYTVLGFVDVTTEIADARTSSRLLGKLDDLEHILMRRVVDEVLIALPLRSHYASIQRAIEVCERAGVRVTYLADAFPLSLGRPSYGQSEQLPVVTMRMVVEDYRLAVKRWVDITGALLGIVLFAPIMLAAALAIKLTSPGPVLFVQERYGWHKRRIRMFKFRTMVADAELMLPALEHRNQAGGPIFKIWDDPRLTRVGRFLRRYSIDELPQLFNVLRGEMSLVGPRPMSLRDVGKFTELGLMRRFSVLPGMTGLWQVSGRSNLPFEQWIALDLKYIDHWSLGLDLAILARTPLVALSGEGAA